MVKKRKLSVAQRVEKIRRKVKNRNDARNKDKKGNIKK